MYPNSSETTTSRLNQYLFAWLRKPMLVQLNREKNREAVALTTSVQSVREKPLDVSRQLIDLIRFS